MVDFYFEAITFNATSTKHFILKIIQKVALHVTEPAHMHGKRVQLLKYHVVCVL